MFIDASKDAPKVSNTPTIRKTNDERCNLVVIISYLSHDISHDTSQLYMAIAV